jgi:hypothetical protein
MDKLEIKGKLESVIKILNEVKDTLDVSEDICTGCGQVARTNYDHYQASQALCAASTRIARASRLICLDGPDH